MKFKSNFTKFLIVLSSILLFSCTKQVENDIDFILLKINSWKKSEHNDVLIYIEKEKNNSTVSIQTLDSKDSLQTKRFEIDNNSFESLVTQCDELKNINLKKAYAVGLDGKDVSIEFGVDGKSLKYYFHEPNDNTKERDLEKFMNLSEKLLLIGNLDKELIR